MNSIIVTMVSVKHGVSGTHVIFEKINWLPQNFVTVVDGVAVKI